MTEKDPLDAAIGAVIRGRRTAARMSLEQLGKAVGVTYQQVQKYETGTNRIAFSTLVRIGAALPGGLPAILRDIDPHDDGTSRLTVGERMEIDTIAEQLAELAPERRRNVLDGFLGIATAVSGSAVSAGGRA